MNSHTEAIAYHGWGFDQHCWESWKSQLAEASIALQAFDRGYFGTACHPTVAATHPMMLLTHSYGLHLCPPEHFEQAQLLVIFGGFGDFHPQGEREKRRSQRILRQMIQGCQQHPEAVLNEFRLNCGADLPEPDLFQRLNQPLLVSDLQCLNESRFDLQRLISIPTIIIFHGTGDRIVPAIKGRAFYQQLQDELVNSQVHYFEMQDAGHVLPFTHSHQCWQQIKTCLEPVVV